jgi:hypothetical protein
MSTAELSLQQAALAYAKAKANVDNHTGPKKGEVFAALLATWRAATLELTEASVRHANGVAA